MVQGNQYYFIDHDVPDEVPQEVQDAIKGALEAKGRDDGGSYILDLAIDILGGLHEAFQHLACAGFAQREDPGVSTARSLTPLGQEKLRVSRSLLNQRLAIGAAAAQWHRVGGADDL